MICTGWRHQRKSGKCKNEAVTRKYLEEAVLGVMRDEVLSKKNMENLLKAIRKKSTTYLSEEKVARERLESVEKKLRKYQDLFERAKIDEDTFIELTKTLRAEKNDIIEKLERMQNVSGESLSSKITKCIKVLGELHNQVYDRDKLRDALRYFIRKIKLGFKNKENTRVMEIEFPPYLDIISAPDGI